MMGNPAKARPLCVPTSKGQTLDLCKAPPNTDRVRLDFAAGVGQRNCSHLEGFES